MGIPRKTIPVWDVYQPPAKVSVYELSRKVYDDLCEGVPEAAREARRRCSDARGVDGLVVNI